MSYCLYEFHSLGAWCNKSNYIAGLMVTSRAITNFISPTCYNELDKFKRSTSLYFHMQFLMNTFEFTIILVADKGSISEKRQRQW